MSFKHNAAGRHRIPQARCRVTNWHCPPRAWAVPRSDKDDSDAQGPRDGYIQLMAKRGRMGWQKATRYSRRNQAKTVMARYRHLIGQTLCTRSLPVQ